MLWSLRLIISVIKSFLDKLLPKARNLVNLKKQKEEKEAILTRQAFLWIKSDRSEVV